MKGIDMRGTKWNRLTIPEDAIPEKRNKSWYWPCVCECGNTCTVEGGRLRRGLTKSCGCYQKERASECSIKNLTGQSYNRLTVIEKDNNRKNNYWLCKCACGNITSVRGIDLQRGQVKSCGCLLKEHIKKFNAPPLNLTGNKYNRLTVLYRVENDKLGHSIWHCKCECGNECDVKGSSLVNGNTQSCGCLKSRGNAKIENLLKKFNILYKKEYQITVKNTYYRYDFALLNNEQQVIRLIEFDGEQHYYYSNGWNNEENFIKQQKHDKIKNQLAKEYNIPLVRIPYWERDNITLKMIMGDKYLIKEDL